ncbi:MAG TPA: UDP-N-acetylmuramate--L-alanine ligase [bacterium]|jgi:UDP-N-acetylmuramate--alanine ligase|nr:UDP-N-acetylmuramate--L-alanine ligase [bacterium]
MFNKLMKLHFVGIGGSGMSGIAEVLLTMGYPVTGSDKSDSEAVRRLKSLGAVVHVGHAAAHVGDAEGVVISNAVPETNPEVLEARRRKIPVIPRAQMLNELMRLKYGVCIAGTHGKTTTTSMCALALDEGGLDPTIVIGGVLDALGGSNARLGKGDYFVVEACEAYASFLQLSPAVAVVTNIDNDHLDHYINMDNLRDAFVRFINRLPFYGFALVCGDDQGVQDIMGRLVRRCITYGFGERNDLIVRIKESGPQGSRFALVKRGHVLGEAQVSIPGKHNVLNATAALGVALELGIPFETAARGLTRFTGVRRRFQSKGSAAGVRVVDDYAHHPTELKATLQAAREAMQGKGRLVVAFQPHLYTRTQLLYRDFAEALEGADQVFVAGIYAARETPIAGVSSQLIADLLTHKGRPVTYREEIEALVPEVMACLREGDLFLTAGAGSIDKLGDAVLAGLKKKEGGNA